MELEFVNEFREFNRYYTSKIELLNAHILKSNYSLPEARILFELFNEENITASDFSD